MVCGSIENAEFHSIFALHGSSILTLHLQNNMLVMLIVSNFIPERMSGTFLLILLKSLRTTYQRAHKVVENWIYVRALIVNMESVENVYL